jgi:high-affinity nickel-transport protein
MTELFGIAAVGFLLGIRHAADPDHIVAVTTLVTRQRGVRSAALVGLTWGAGHTLTILAAGSAIILLGLAIPAGVSLSLELLVCAMLVGLGLATLADAKAERRQGATAQRVGLQRPLLVGLVHGLAGSAAVAILVLATMQSRAWSVLYLLVYGAGTMIGMMLIPVAIAIPFLYAGDRIGGLTRRLHLGSGLVSIGAGLILAYGMVRG